MVDFEEDENAKNILKILRLNISQAYLKTKQYSEVIENCNKVLKDDEKNVKALYRRGSAHLFGQDFEKAKVICSLIIGRFFNDCRS